MLALLTVVQVESDAQMTFRNLRGGRGRGGKGQYMARHVGYFYQVGFEVQQSSCLRGFGTSLQFGMRQKNRWSYFGGIIPGMHITEFHKYIQGPYFEGRKIDHRWHDGDYPETDGWHYADFSWRYFAMPIYGGAMYEFLNGKVTPVAEGRLGCKVKARFGVAPYGALIGGCRVALERVSVIPFIGYVFNDIKDDYGLHAVSFGVQVGF
jgi:hypothetical protein